MVRWVSIVDRSFRSHLDSCTDESRNSSTTSKEEVAKWPLRDRCHLQESSCHISWFAMQRKLLPFTRELFQPRYSIVLLRPAALESIFTSKYGTLSFRFRPKNLHSAAKESKERCLPRQRRYLARPAFSRLESKTWTLHSGVPLMRERHRRCHLQICSGVTDIAGFVIHSDMYGLSPKFKRYLRLNRLKNVSVVSQR